MKIKLISGLLLSIILTIVTHSSFAADWNTNDDGVVLNGYDVVAYRTKDMAVIGLPEHSVKHDGVIFHFSNQDHKDLFVKSPDQYLPKYNGYCAFAVGANNAKVPANPDTFKLYNGELLVFFNDQYEGNKFNTKVPWNENESKLYSKAEQNWAKLK